MNYQGIEILILVGVRTVSGSTHESEVAEIKGAEIKGANFEIKNGRENKPAKFFEVLLDENLPGMTLFTPDPVYP